MHHYVHLRRELQGVLCGPFALRQQLLVGSLGELSGMLIQGIDPEGPLKVGCFLGYRLVETYVSRRGESSLADVFEQPARLVLESSGYWTQ